MLLGRSRPVKQAEGGENSLNYDDDDEKFLPFDARLLR
jgi:hypothetical protein